MVWERGLHEIEVGKHFDPDHSDFEQVTENIMTSMDDEEGGSVELYAPIFNANGPCVTAMPAGEVVPGIGPVPIKRESSLIVMIRHGKTENNKLGLFTGWDDVPLAADGVEEAKRAGKLLKLHGFEFDAVYTSWLSRAIETAWYVMDEMDCLWLPIVKSWRLNESKHEYHFALCRDFECSY
jgi:2,3-bisphosphoglycerate-dependent phosphoglycerate mutase